MGKMGAAKTLINMVMMMMMMTIVTSRVSLFLCINVLY